MARKKRNLREDVVGLTSVGVGTTIGARLLNIAGAGNAASGVANTTGFFPATGTVLGAGVTLNVLRELEPKKRKRR